MGKDKKKKELYRKGYNFWVWLEDQMISFKRISGLSDEGNTEVLREGGRNTMVYSLFQPKSGERVITLERGLISDEKEFELYKAGSYFFFIDIDVLGDDGFIIKTYRLEDCWIRKASINDFDASNSSLLSVTIEIVYQTLTEE